MCDGCSELFSVNESGWKEFQESIPTHLNNAYNHGKRTMHMCAECAPHGTTSAPRPVVRSLSDRMSLDKGQDE